MTTLGNTAIDKITGQLGEAVGLGHVSRSPAEGVSYGWDCWPRRYLLQRELPVAPPPYWVVWPGAAAEVSNVLKLANRQNLRVVIYGAGSSLMGLPAVQSRAARKPRPTVILDTKRMRQVLHLEESSLVLHTQAGISGRELEEGLARRSLQLGHIPSSLYFSTLGGWLATRSAGELTARYGRIDDLCLALTVVLPTGRLIHTRVAPRRSAGPDMMRVFFGSEGTLGVITAATLRLRRRYEARLWLSAAFASGRQALEALGEILFRSIRPAVGVLLDPRVRQPFAPNLEADRWLLNLSFEGPEPLVSAERDCAATALAHGGGTILGGDPARLWWQTRHKGTFELLKQRSAKNIIADEMDFAASWSRLFPVAEAVQNSLQSLGAEVSLQFSHFSLEGGCILVRFTFPLDANQSSTSDAQPAVELYDRAWRAGLQACRRAGGSVVHHRAVGRQRLDAAVDEMGAQRQLLTQLKQKLDPKGLLNPGLLGLGTQSAARDAKNR
jgi:alkyldihydroxyacetonephosphate synthase